MMSEQAYRWQTDWLTDRQHIKGWLTVLNAWMEYCVWFILFSRPVPLWLSNTDTHPFSRDRQQRQMAVCVSERERIRVCPRERASVCLRASRELASVSVCVQEHLYVCVCVCACSCFGLTNSLVLEHRARFWYWNETRPYWSGTLQFNQVPQRSVHFISSAAIYSSVYTGQEWSRQPLSIAFCVCLCVCVCDRWWAIDPKITMWWQCWLAGGLDMSGCINDGKVWQAPCSSTSPYLLLTSTSLPSSLHFYLCSTPLLHLSPTSTLPSHPPIILSSFLPHPSPPLLSISPPSIPIPSPITPLWEHPS